MKMYLATLFGKMAVTIDFERWALCETWDFKVHYTNGETEDWRNVNVNDVNTIILQPNGVNTYL